MFFCLFSFFSNNIRYRIKSVDFSKIWTRIVRVEGEHADHLTTTTALGRLVKYLMPIPKVWTWKEHAQDKIKLVFIYLVKV